MNRVCGLVALLALAGTAGAALRAEDAPKPDPNHCVLVLTLDKGLEGGRPLLVYLDQRQGKFPRGLANAPKFNSSLHSADPAGLTLTHGELKGALKVALAPDAWVPRDHKPVDCAYTLDAKVKGETVEGAFEGTCGKAAVKGALTGNLVSDQLVPLANCRAEFTLENALVNVQDYLKRVTVSFEQAGGKPDKGKVVIKVTGTDTMQERADVSKVVLADGKLTGQLAQPVTKGKEPDPKTNYIYELDGMVLGAFVGGAFTGKIGDKELKGTFRGTVAPLAPATK